MKDDRIKWEHESNSKHWYGLAITKSGKRCSINECDHMVGKRYFTVFIEGDKKHCATRATLEKVYQILDTH